MIISSAIKTKEGIVYTGFRHYSIFQANPSVNFKFGIQGLNDDFYACDCSDNILECEPAYAKKGKCENCNSNRECYDPDGKEKLCYSTKKD